MPYAPRPPGQVAALVLAIHYAWVSLAELILGMASGDGRFDTEGGTILLEYAQPHTGLHILLVAVFLTAAFGPLRLRPVLLLLVAAIFVAVVAQGLLAPQAAGDALGHEGGMPLAYTLNNIGVLLVAAGGGIQSLRARPVAPT